MERADSEEDDLDHDHSHLRVPIRFEQISREADVKTFMRLPSTKCFKCIFDHLFLKPNIRNTGEDQNTQQENHLKTMMTLAYCFAKMSPRTGTKARLRTRTPFDIDKVEIGSP